MAQRVILPRQGQSVETCLILHWRKREGEPIREGETLVEVETDKAAFEVPSTASGTVLRLLRAEGEDVPVLATLAIVGQAGEDISALLAAEAGAADSAAQTSAAGGVPSAGGGVPSAARVAISPRARRLAARSGLDPEAVAAALGGRGGSGPRGRILEQDVRAALLAPRVAPRSGVAASASLGAPEGASPPPAAWAGPVTEAPIKGLRRVVAERLLASVQASAQYTLHASACAEALLGLRQRLKESPEGMGLREITVNDLVNCAASRVLPGHPDLNAHFDGALLRRYERVHLGVAIDTPKGLMVPVVRDAGRLPLRALAAETARLREACLKGTVSPDELSGGTFTVTNLGSLGIEAFTPVLNPPQVAILGVGGVVLRPVQSETGVVFRRYLGLSLTADHRIVDGAPAARFLRALADTLERVELLLLQ